MNQLRIINCLVTAFVLCTFAISCAHKAEPNGYDFDLEDLQRIEPKISSQKDVLDTMGSPTIESNFNRKWIYYSDLTKRRIVRQPKVLERKIVVVSFDERGMVEDILQYTDNSVAKTNHITESTTTHSIGNKEPGLWERFWKNIGRVGPSFETTE